MEESNSGLLSDNGVPSHHGVRRHAVLDGFALLNFCNVELPSHAEECVARGHNLSEVVTEDSSYFTCLSRIDVSDNHLNLCDFSSFPKLEELELSCNGIITLHDLELGKFEALLSLNLSYNNIDAVELASLSYIPHLQHLNVSHNNLTQLPFSISGLESLTTINLSHNKLSGYQAVSALAGIAQIKSIDLSHNFIDMSGPGSETTFKEGFGALQSMNLAHNCIEVFTPLARLATKPKLQTLVISGNVCVSNKRLLRKLMEKGRGMTKLHFNVVADDPKPTSSTLAQQVVSLDKLYKSVHLVQLGPEVLPTREQWTTLGMYGSLGIDPKSKRSQHRKQIKKFTVSQKNSSTIKQVSKVPDKHNSLDMSTTVQDETVHTSRLDNQTPSNGEQVNINVSQVRPPSDQRRKRNSMASRPTSRRTTDGNNNDETSIPKLSDGFGKHKQFFLTQPGILELVDKTPGSDWEVETKMHEIAGIGQGLRYGKDTQIGSKQGNQDRLRKAIAELRYALSNPLTSTEDGEDELHTPHFQQLKKVNKARVQTKHPYKSPRDKMDRDKKVVEVTANRNPLGNIEALLDTIDTDMDSSVVPASTSPKHVSDPLQGLVTMVNEIIDNFHDEEVELQSQRASVAIGR